MPRITTLFANLGIVNRKYLRQFLQNNDVSASDVLLERVDFSKNYDPKTIKINGKPLEYIEALTIAYNKPKGQPESEIWSIFPSTFINRRPPLRVMHPLPDDISGLVVYTQFHDVFQRSTSSNFPIKRTYSLEVTEEFTGKEAEAINLLKGTIKSRLKDAFKERTLQIHPENRRIAKLEIFDYKPDKVAQMLVALRHEVVSIHRTHLGEFHIGELKPGEWRALNAEEVEQLLCRYNEKPKVLQMPPPKEEGEVVEPEKDLWKSYLDEDGDPIEELKPKYSKRKQSQ